MEVTQLGNKHCKVPRVRCVGCDAVFTGPKNSSKCPECGATWEKIMDEGEWYQKRKMKQHQSIWIPIKTIKGVQNAIRRHHAGNR